MPEKSQSSVPDTETPAHPEMPLEFNPLQQNFRQNPYPTYRQFREADPVHWSAMFGFWVCTRYDDIVAILRHSKASANPRDWERFDDYVEVLGGTGPAYDMQSRWMLLKNPPDHTRLRKLVAKAFTPRVVEDMRPHIQAIVHDLLNAVHVKRRFDIIQDVAFPLPVIVIAELIGVPAQDREYFKGWTAALARSLDPIITPEITQAADKATEELLAYFTALVAERRDSPQDDLLSGLIAAEEEGDKLDEDELLATAILLFAAGHETTMNLIGNGMLALFRNPGQMAKLRADPSLIKTAVEEFLRYDGSVQITARVALEDIEVGGKTIGKHQQALLLLGAANRDPARFSDPDRLDITRRENPHLTFGHGIHHCLGAPLARVEAQIAINSILCRMPDIQLATDQLEWRDMLTLRGLKALPVIF